MSLWRFSSLFARPQNLHSKRGALRRAAAQSEESMEDDIARAARAKKGSPFLSTEQAAFYLGLSARKLQAMRAGGSGPSFRRHSRYVRYHIDDLDSWSKDQSGAGATRA
jgi:hypothetical protein